MKKITYKDAGVDIQKANQTLDRLKNNIAKTFNNAVLTDIGTFGACYDLSQGIKNYKQPILVQSIDGVGTKTKLAQKLGIYKGLGHDLLSACSNDIAVMGAKPLVLMDYIATSALEPKIIESIITGLTEACQNNGVALIGGETAEMPQVYNTHQFDLVGVITGVVDKENVINGQAIQPGDQIYGLTASGLHTNGYTLAQHLTKSYNLNQSYSNNDSRTLGEALLEPHINYTSIIQYWLENNFPIHGMAHITGGGLIDNVKRILPQSAQAHIDINRWPVPPIFELLQELGNLDTSEAYQTFNMGIGLVVIGPQALESKLSEALTNEIKCYTIGETVDGETSVHLLKPES